MLRCGKTSMNLCSALPRTLGRRGRAAHVRLPLCRMPVVHFCSSQSTPSIENTDDLAKMDRLHVVLDQSGSMRSMAATVFEGARELLDGVANDGSVCITRFSSQVELGADTSPAIAKDKWNPGDCQGMTALYDAITTAIDHDLCCHATLESVTIAIVTDGCENASTHSSLAQVKEKIRESEDNGWRIVFLGANQDAVLTAETMGIRSGHSMTFGLTDQEQRGAFQSLRAANSRYARGGDGSFTRNERMQSHAAHSSKQGSHSVDLGFDPQTPGSTKWVSLDPRTGNLIPFDDATTAHLEYCWTTMQSTAEITQLGAVVFFDSAGNHVQKTRYGERCVRCVSAGDTVLTRVFGANGHRIVGVIEADQPMRERLNHGTTRILVT